MSGFGIRDVRRVSYTEIGCHLFQEHCQTYQEYVNLSRITKFEAPCGEKVEWFAS